MPTVEHSNWTVEYHGSADEPMWLGKCDYAGVHVIYSAAVPYVYVNYETKSAPGPLPTSSRARTRSRSGRR